MEELQGIIIKEPDAVHVDESKTRMFKVINTDIKFQEVSNPQRASIMLFGGAVIEIQPFRNNIVIIMKHERAGHESNTLLLDGSLTEKGTVVFANCNDVNGTKGDITGLSAEQVEYLMELYKVDTDFNTFTNGFYE